MAEAVAMTERRSGDEVELRAKLRALADAYAAEFAEDAQYVTFDGSRLDGRRQIADGHRALFARSMRGSRLYSELTEIRFPAPDVAIIHGRGALLKRHQKEPAKRRVSVNTTVAVRRNDHWSIVAFHNTRYRPFATTLFGRLLRVLESRRNPEAAVLGDRSARGRTHAKSPGQM
jgi:uncharacterized protein (TIGR02246 family)